MSAKKVTHTVLKTLSMYDLVLKKKKKLIAQEAY